MSLYLLLLRSQFSGLSSGDLFNSSATAAKGSCQSRASTCCSPTRSCIDRSVVAGRLPSSVTWCVTKNVPAATSRIHMKPFPPTLDSFESSANIGPHGAAGLSRPRLGTKPSSTQTWRTRLGPKRIDGRRDGPSPAAEKWRSAEASPALRMYYYTLYV